MAASFVFTASLWVFPAFYALAHGSHHEMVKHKLLAGEGKGKRGDGDCCAAYGDADADDAPGEEDEGHAEDEHVASTIDLPKPLYRTLYL